jgi:hypothetical protein
MSLTRRDFLATFGAVGLGLATLRSLLAGVLA